MNIHLHPPLHLNTVINQPLVYSGIANLKESGDVVNFEVTSQSFFPLISMLCLLKCMRTVL
jgi:hypothetical protein